ncbi:MAG: hypothetical protein ACT4O6_18730 [Reyranella sp.]
MPIRSDNKALRTVLLVDAATCVVAGAVMALGAALVNGLTNIPTTVLLPAGLSLFLIAAFMAFVATRPILSKPAVWLIIVGNAAWVVGSLYLAMGGAIAPNLLGQVFIGSQAAAVAILTLLERRGVAQMQGEFA